MKERKILRKHFRIDLIILDLNLPKVSEMDILKFLKKDSRYCSIPVVNLSTSSEQVTFQKHTKMELMVILLN